MFRFAKEGRRESTATKVKCSIPRCSGVQDSFLPSHVLGCRILASCRPSGPFSSGHARHAPIEAAGPCGECQAEPGAARFVLSQTTGYRPIPCQATADKFRATGDRGVQTGGKPLKDPRPDKGISNPGEPSLAPPRVSQLSSHAHPPFPPSPRKVSPFPVPTYGDLNRT